MIMVEPLVYVEAENIDDVLHKVTYRQRENSQWSSNADLGLQSL